MPYSIRFEKGAARPWKIVNTDRNEVVGSSISKAMAQKAVAAREMAKHNPGKMRKK